MTPCRRDAKHPTEAKAAERPAHPRDPNLLTFWPSSLTLLGDIRSWLDIHDQNHSHKLLNYIPYVLPVPSQTTLSYFVWFCTFFPRPREFLSLRCLLSNPTLPWGPLRSPTIAISTSQSQFSLSLPSKRWLLSFFFFIAFPYQEDMLKHIFSTHVHIFIYELYTCINVVLRYELLLGYGSMLKAIDVYPYCRGPIWWHLIYFGQFQSNYTPMWLIKTHTRNRRGRNTFFSLFTYSSCFQSAILCKIFVSPLSILGAEGISLAKIKSS